MYGLVIMCSKVRNCLTGDTNNPTWSPHPKRKSGNLRDSARGEGKAEGSTLFGVERNLAAALRM